MTTLSLNFTVQNRDYKYIVDSVKITNLVKRNIQSCDLTDETECQSVAKLVQDSYAVTNEEDQQNIKFVTGYPYHTLMSHLKESFPTDENNTTVDEYVQHAAELEQKLDNLTDQFNLMMQKITAIGNGNNESKQNVIQTPNSSSIKTESQINKVSEDDKIARKKALDLISSGKIPKYEEKETVRKFLKNTVKIFAEDCNQKPANIATWIHKCFSSDEKLQPQRLKDIAATIVSSNPNISTFSFLKEFGEKLVPSDTTPFNFKRNSHESVSDAVYRLTEENEEIETKLIAKAIVVNETDRWIKENLKRNIDFTKEINAKELKVIAEKCDKECEFKPKKTFDDEIISLNYLQRNANGYQNAMYRNQRYMPNPRPQYNLLSKFCATCKSRFLPKFISHRLCNACFEDKISKQNKTTPKNSNRSSNQSFNNNAQFSNNRRIPFNNNRLNSKLQIRNINYSGVNCLEVFNLTDFADKVLNNESALKSRIGLKIPALNDYNEEIECYGLLDSGSNTNVTSKKFMDENHFSYIPKAPTYAQTANPEASIDIIGKASIGFGSNNEICNFEVTKQNLGENSGFDFILGTPFLEKIGAMDQLRNSAQNFTLKNM